MAGESRLRSGGGSRGLRLLGWAVLLGLTGWCSAWAEGQAFSAPSALTAGLESRRVGRLNYVDAEHFLARYGLEAEWIEAGRRQRFKSAWTTLDLEVDTREIAFNELRVFLGEAVVLWERRLWVAELDAWNTLAPLLRPAQFAAAARPVRKIVLDAGHGGRDGGTGNTKLKLVEKTFTLDVARRLGALLVGMGFEVAQTRTDDTYLSLAERAAAARAEAADLFVSIHFNATEGQPSVRGIETYVLTPRHQRSTSSAGPGPDDAKLEPGNAHDAWNTVLGLQLHRALRRGLKAPDRGLKRARFAVLRLAECPAVLVEAGYLSNDAEARLIAQESHRIAIAQALAEGIAAYADQVTAVGRRPGRR